MTTRRPPSASTTDVCATGHGDRGEAGRIADQRPDDGPAGGATVQGDGVRTTVAPGAAVGESHVSAVGRVSPNAVGVEPDKGVVEVSVIMPATVKVALGSDVTVRSNVNAVQVRSPKWQNARSVACELWLSRFRCRPVSLPGLPAGRLGRCRQWRRPRLLTRPRRVHGWLSQGRSCRRRRRRRRRLARRRPSVDVIGLSNDESCLIGFSVPTLERMRLR